RRGDGGAVSASAAPAGRASPTTQTCRRRGAATTPRSPRRGVRAGALAARHLVAVCVLVGGCGGVLLPEGDLLRDVYLRGSPAEELGATRAAVDAALARAGVLERPAITLFRPPFGFLTEAAAGAAREAGFHIVEWTVSVRDWEAGRRPDQIADSILARAHP